MRGTLLVPLLQKPAHTDRKAIATVCIADLKDPGRHGLTFPDTNLRDPLPYFGDRGDRQDRDRAAMA